MEPVKSIALIRIVPAVSLVMLLCLRITPAFAEPPRIIHVFVALCDNVHQGIVPVPEKLGNGDDPAGNLYWGAMYGVKTWFRKSEAWELIMTEPGTPPVMERCIFRHKNTNVYLLADAWQGKHIRQCTTEFLKAAAGYPGKPVTVKQAGSDLSFTGDGGADLLVYVGHDGLMDFKLEKYPEKQDDRSREVIILACLSRDYFRSAIHRTGAQPLLWTTGLMAPEAYTLETALEGWVNGENAQQIRNRAATAYARYQKCALEAAEHLLVTGLN